MDLAGREPGQSTDLRDILHVDLDAFYASVEELVRPDLGGKPLVVGWPGPRGVILSANYAARRCGVRNGMPGVRAKRLCPGATFVPPNFPRYVDASTAFRGILESFTPQLETLALDEAFLDVSGAHGLFGTSAQIGHAIRAQVFGQLNITCSVGIGNTKLVAKMANRACKPNGLLEVEDAKAFMDPLEVSEIWGVGQATATQLNRLGIFKVAQLASIDLGTLSRALGANRASSLAALANNQDLRGVSGSVSAQSVGAERTFDVDKTDDRELMTELLALADRVASRLSGQPARTVTLKIRLSGFETFTRSKTILAPTADVLEIYRVVCELFRAFDRKGKGVRLAGISATNLESGEYQPDLGVGVSTSSLLDGVRKRFGDGAISLGSLVARDPKDVS